MLFHACVVGATAKAPRTSNAVEIEVEECLDGNGSTGCLHSRQSPSGQFNSNKTYKIAGGFLPPQFVQPPLKMWGKEIFSITREILSLARQEIIG